MLSGAMNSTRLTKPLARSSALPVSVEDDPTGTGGKRVVLRGRVTVADAAEFKRAAVAVAAGYGPVTVDCKAATHLDAAAVQMVIALGRAVEEGGRRCVVEAGEASALFRLAGLGALVSG